MQSVKVKDFFIGQGQKLAIISGPCVIESEEMAIACAMALKEIIAPFPFNLIFKASFDKANRSSGTAFRGPGLEEGLRILERVKQESGLPILTDIHLPEHAAAAAAVCDIIQIPAFLCRQTDLLLAAGQSGRAVNIKKGQFVSPWDMRHAVEKVRSAGCHDIILTDRGSSFGYNNLVSDMRAIPVMQQLGYPVCFDGTHSVQLPGALGAASGGQREFIAPLCKAAIAAGANALFIESHPTPETAKSDSASMLAHQDLARLLPVLEKIYAAVNS